MPDFYRRSLPHWIPDKASFFITYRLVKDEPEI
jgi:hypothetical protein